LPAEEDDQVFVFNDEREKNALRHPASLVKKHPSTHSPAIRAEKMDREAVPRYVVSATNQ
jgi:hypothetical protein